MIRFIDLTDQILDDTFMFAWYDTVRAEFVYIGGFCTWSSWDDFEDDYNNFGHHNFTLERFRSLFKTSSTPKRRIITFSSVNVRTRPGNGGFKGRLLEKDIVRVFEEREDEFKLKYIRIGENSWIAKRYTERIEL